MERERGCTLNKMRCWDGDGDKGRKWGEMHRNRWREEEEEEEERLLLL